MDSKPYQPTIDVSLIERLPSELKYVIKTLTFVAQMQAAYSTNDLEEMARRVCNYPGLEPSSDAVDGKTTVCWLTALVSYVNILESQQNKHPLSSISVYEYQILRSTVQICQVLTGQSIQDGLYSTAQQW